VPSRRGAPDIFGNGLTLVPTGSSAITTIFGNRLFTVPNIFGNGLAQSLSKSVGGITSTVYAISGCIRNSSWWCAPASLASTKKIGQCLSFSGRHLMSAKKSLHLLGMRTDWFA
jgi:hypothetical protein